MGCNSLIRLLFSTFSDYVSAPKPCNSVGPLSFRIFTFRILISAPYKLLVTRRVWQDNNEHSPLIFKITYSESTHSFTHAPLRVILSRCLTNSKWSCPSNVEVF